MNMNILIVDDEKSLRNSYREMLKKEGFNLFEAPGAVEAKEILLSKTIDLVLLDLNMPDIRGEELFQVMRAFHKNTKIIVTSVYPIDEQKKAAPNADDFFDKSDGPKILIKKVRFHLNKTVGKGKIIIVDDDKSTRILYKRYFEKAGYKIECFSDCKSTIQFIKKGNNRFHLIALDISMPDLDAQYAFDIVRENHKEAKVLIVSCHDVKFQSKIIPQADGYIDKSDGAEALLAKIENMINNK